MPGIADLIYEQMQRAGQPRTVTQTGTIEQKAPLDLGSLGLLLYMMLSQGKNKGNAFSPDSTALLNQVSGPMQTQPYTSAAQQNPIDLLLKIFGGMGGIGGAGGLR